MSLFKYCRRNIELTDLTLPAPSKVKAQVDFYRKVYQIKDTDNDLETGLVCTKLWTSEGDNEKEDGKEGSSLGSTADIPNGEVDAGSTHNPAMTTLLPIPILTPSSTDPSGNCALAFTQPSPPMPEMSSSAVSLSNLMSNPGSGTPNLTTSLATDGHQPETGNVDCTSGLRMPLPSEALWEQNGGFTSMTQEFDFAMAGLDMDYPTGLGAQNYSDSHAALLQQNSMPHGGTDMAYDNMGMSNLYWQTMNFPNSTNVSVPANDYASQTPFHQAVPTFPSTTNVVSLNMDSDCTVGPIDNTDNTSTSTMPSQPTTPPLGALATERPSPSSGTNLPSNSQQVSTGTEPSNDLTPSIAPIHGHQVASLSTNKEDGGPPQDNPRPKQPFQDTSNMNRMLGRL